MNKEDIRILIACEESGTVRDALVKLGYAPISCDILPSRTPGLHYEGDIFEIIYEGWDLMIAFPPCTHLAVSGAKHFAQKRLDGRQQQGIDFFMQMIDAPIHYIAVENPVGIMSSEYRKPDQIIQPWQFGDEAQKTTCLWLKNLPQLIPTKLVGKGEFYTAPSGKKLPKWYGDAEVNGKKLAYGSDLLKQIRSKTFTGIAEAMAKQWAEHAYSQLKLSASYPQLAQAI